MSLDLLADLRAELEATFLNDVVEVKRLGYGRDPNTGRDIDVETVIYSGPGALKRSGRDATAFDLLLPVTAPEVLEGDTVTADGRTLAITANTPQTVTNGALRKVPVGRREGAPYAS